MTRAPESESRARQAVHGIPAGPGPGVLADGVVVATRTVEVFSDGGGVVQVGDGGPAAEAASMVDAAAVSSELRPGERSQTPAIRVR